MNKTSNENLEKKCFICRRSDKNEIVFGEWKTLNDITVHYYCLVSYIKSFLFNL